MLVRDDHRRAVVLADVGEEDEARHLRRRSRAVGDDEGVVAEVAVVGLVVVDGAGVLRPQLGLVEAKVGRAEEAGGEVDEVGVEGQPVEVPRAPWPDLQPGELAVREALVPGRVGEVVGGAGELGPQRFLGGGELVGVEEPLDHCEAALAQLLERGLRHVHRHCCSPCPPEGSCPIVRGAWKPSSARRAATRVDSTGRATRRHGVRLDGSLNVHRA